MNIFAIEATSDGQIDWHGSAKSHDNYRVNKMIIESCQMLSTNAQVMGYPTRYRKAFQNHPSTVWARSSATNFINLFYFANYLRDEYCRRYQKTSHGCDDVLYHMKSLVGDLYFLSRFPAEQPTKLPLCMPDEYKISADPVVCYRNYFANKPNLRYFEGDVPDWISVYRSSSLPEIQVIQK
jgi:hypothetical protein